MATNDAPAQPKPVDRIPAPPPAAIRRTAAGRTSTTMIDAAPVARATIVAIRILSIALMLLSFVGSMASMQGVAAPTSWDAFVALFNAWGALGALLQVLLTLGQWGGRALISEDWRWWGLYLGSLALSVWLNWLAFAPLLPQAPWALVGIVIIGGDVLPEFVLLKGRG